MISKKYVQGSWGTDVFQLAAKSERLMVVRVVCIITDAVFALDFFYTVLERTLKTDAIQHLGNKGDLEPDCQLPSF